MSRRLCRRELGDRARSFSNSVLRELTRENQTHRRLDLTRRDRALLVVAGKLRGLRGNALENILHKRVQNSHGLVRDTRVRVDLLQDTVDVGRVSLLSNLAARFLLLRRLCRGL